ncbi:MAG: hypothetical protein V2B19_19470 [Pseudomonadota bacterium]
MSDSEFLPVWKKYPGVADTMIKAVFFGGRTNAGSAMRIEG